MAEVVGIAFHRQAVDADDGLFSREASYSLFACFVGVGAGQFEYTVCDEVLARQLLSTMALIIFCGTSS